MSEAGSKAPANGFDADALARLESFNRHLYRPNTYLHKWWARRCGTTFRWILKQLVEDPERRGYYAPGGLEGKVILDPMMGGGTTLHEAIRLGASVIGVDVDPIPVLQARASLTPTPLGELEEAFQRFHATLREKLAPLWTTTCPTCSQTSETRYALHGLRRECDCGERIFVDSLSLRHEPDGRELRLCPDCLEVQVDGECRGCARQGRAMLRLKGEIHCLDCAAHYRELTHIPYWSRFGMLVVVGQCPNHGQFFRQPGPEDEANLQRADAVRDLLSFDAGEFRVAAGPKSRDLPRRGIQSYLDLFSSRQLAYLRGAIDALGRFNADIRLNLALLVSTSLEFHSMLCGYKGGHSRRPGAIRHTFSHHAYSFPHTALEANPVFPGRGSGTLENLFDDRIRKARRWALRPVEKRLRNGSVVSDPIPGEVDSGIEVANSSALRDGQRRFLLLQGSAALLPMPDASVDYIVTDPPYFDSVQYSDLAAYFRVWLRQMLPDSAAWAYDVLGSAVDSPQHGIGHYQQVLGKIFTECRRVLRPSEGRLVFTFHHWRPEAWTALTLALGQAGFRLVRFEVIHSENPASVHVANLRALTHDTILHLRPPGSPIESLWPRIDRVDTTDSERLSHGCAAALGWMLGANRPADIPAQWRSLFGSPLKTPYQPGS